MFGRRRTPTRHARLVRITQHVKWNFDEFRCVFRMFSRRVNDAGIDGLFGSVIQVFYPNNDELSKNVRASECRRSRFFFFFFFFFRCVDRIAGVDASVSAHSCACDALARSGTRWVFNFRNSRQFLLSTKCHLWLFVQYALHVGLAGTWNLENLFLAIFCFQLLLYVSKMLEDIFESL
jgi:hypothetical protein